MRSSKVAVAAIGALRSLGGRPAVAVLLAATSCPDASVRTAAVLALRAILFPAEASPGFVTQDAAEILSAARKLVESA